jgi:hypothetical protein
MERSLQRSQSQHRSAPGLQPLLLLLIVTGYVFNPMEILCIDFLSKLMVVKID